MNPSKRFDFDSVHFTPATPAIHSIPDIRKFCLSSRPFWFDLFFSILFLTSFSLFAQASQGVSQNIPAIQPPPLVSLEASKLKKVQGKTYWENRKLSNEHVWNLHFVYRSADQSILYKDAELEVDYEKPSQETLSFSEGEIFRVVASSENGEEIYQTDFDARTQIGEPPFASSNGDSGSFRSVHLDSLDLMVKIPLKVVTGAVNLGGTQFQESFLKKITLYRLFPQGGKREIAEFDLPVPGSDLYNRKAAPQPKRISAGYSVIQTLEREEQKEPDNQEYFDIVITADDLTSENLSLFETYAEEYASTLFSIQPFEALREKIRIHVLPNTTEDLGCRHSNPSVPRVVTCNSAKVLGFIHSHGIPYEQGAVSVIYFSNTYGGAATNIGVCTSGDPSTQQKGPAVCLAHELGHSAFRLLDEYAYNDPGYPSEGPEYNEVRMNCFFGSQIPAPEWSEIVALKDYRAKCKYADNYHRPHPISLMFSLGAPFFNWPSLQIVRTRLEEASSIQEDSSPPSSLLTFPNDLLLVGDDTFLQLAKGNILLHPWSEDESGKVPWVRVLMNGHFFMSVYGETLSMGTTSDEMMEFATTHGIPLDQIHLKFEAVDSFGNRQLSKAYRVFWKEKKDKKGPKIEWVDSQVFEEGVPALVRVRAKDLTGVSMIVGVIEGANVSFKRVGEEFQGVWTPSKKGKVSLEFTGFDAQLNRSKMTKEVRVR